MSAVVCALRIELALFESASLKDKRAVVRRVRDRVRNKFNAAVAEVGDLDDPAAASLVFVTVSNSAAHSHAAAQHIQRFVERLAIDAEVTTIETEIIRL